MTKHRKKVESGDKKIQRRAKRTHKILVPEFKGAPDTKIRVLLVDANPGQPVSEYSYLGAVKSLSRSRSIVPEATIYAGKCGAIKEIYLEKGDTVSGGEPFALIELFDKSEFKHRSDEYEATLESNDDITLVKYPEILEGSSPEILRRAAKLMIGIYRYWYSDEVSYPPEECVHSPFGVCLLTETNFEPDEFFSDESWDVSRLMSFGGENTSGIDVWFEDDHLRFDFLEERFANARYEGASSKEVFRYSNLLRWVFDNERAISEDSDLGDERVEEIYRVIELEKGVETRIRPPQLIRTTKS